MKKTDSPKCTFCTLYDESITHVFFECIELKSLWHYVTAACNKIGKKDISLSCKHVIQFWDMIREILKM